jgi:DNA (cytosine-5)-methyltransferase 1
MGSRDIEYVDLFAGAGGLSTGLENAGFELVHAVEVDEDARTTFAHNRDGWEASDLSGDIRDIDVSEITSAVGQDSVDLVVGGPPCQGFSEVVSPDGSDERNHLFENFIDWVGELDPDVALFENVRGMEKTAGGKFLTAVTESFDRMGYEVSDRVLRSSDFGVPQHRRRLIVIATKSEVSHNPFDGFEIDPVVTPGVIDAVGDLPRVAPGEEKKKYSEPPHTVLQRDLRGDTDELSAHIAANHSDEMVEMISHIPDGGDRTSIPEDLQPSSGYHNSYSRLKSDEPAVAITSNMSKPSSARCIHPFQNRGLTPREGARLQTFPDEYTFFGGLVSIRQQIGNAVPPYLGEALGYYLKRDVLGRDLSGEDRKRIRKIRSGSVSIEEFDQNESTAGQITKQATLDLS